MVQWLCEGRTITILIFFPKLPSKIFRFLLDYSTASARCQPDAPLTCLGAKGFFQICHKFSLNKIVEATAGVNLYRNHMASVCLHIEAPQFGARGSL